jgi:hypothetical protein
MTTGNSVLPRIVANWLLVFCDLKENLPGWKTRSSQAWWVPSWWCMSNAMIKPRLPDSILIIEVDCDLVQCTFWIWYSAYPTSPLRWLCINFGGFIHFLGTPIPYGSALWIACTRPGLPFLHCLWHDLQLSGEGFRRPIWRNIHLTTNRLSSSSAWGFRAKGSSLHRPIRKISDIDLDCPLGFFF